MQVKGTTLTLQRTTGESFSACIRSCECEWRWQILIQLNCIPRQQAESTKLLITGKMPVPGSIIIFHNKWQNPAMCITLTCCMYSLVSVNFSLYVLFSIMQRAWISYYCLKTNFMIDKIVYFCCHLIAVKWKLRNTTTSLKKRKENKRKWDRDINLNTFRVFKFQKRSKNDSHTMLWYSDNANKRYNHDNAACRI